MISRKLAVLILSVTALMAAVALAATAGTAKAAPPSSGITAVCTIGGNSTVSGYKGNPSSINFIWTDALGGTTNNPDFNPPKGSDSMPTPQISEGSAGNLDPVTFTAQVSYSGGGGTTYSITVPCS